eukprot:m51a1_g10501 hypothetical protein (1969) ;mRNA; f:115388-127899
MAAGADDEVQWLIAAVLALAAHGSKRVIVQLEDPPAGLTRSDRSSAARAIQDRFLNSFKREARFTAVLNAVAVEVAEGSETEHVVQRMRSLPGVVNAWPDAQHRQTLFASGPLVGLPAAWGELLPRRAGEGVKVAVVDGGTSKDVPMMSGAGFAWPHDIPAPGLGETDNCNGKIVVSRTTSTAAGVPVTIKTAEGARNISGMAPFAWVMNYKVFYINNAGKTAGGGTVEILQALEDAVLNGAAVISNSWASRTMEDSQSPISVFCTRATLQHNVVFVFAAGNSGPMLTTMDHPETTSIRVAASSTAKKSWIGIATRPSLQTLFPNASLESNMVNIQKPSAATQGWISAVAPQFNNSYGCERLEGKNYTGKAVVVRYGVCYNQVQMDNLAAAGASAIIVVSGFEAPASIFVTEDYGLAIVGIVRSGGDMLLKMLQSTNDVSVSFELFSGSSASDVIADFSSRGPSTDMNVGIDVSAPGQTIVAQGYGNGNGVQKHFGFGISSGTSMACPHVAGIAALIKQRHPEFTAAEVKSALMTTSTIDVALDASRTVMASPLDTGAGRVVASAALDPTVFMQPQALSFAVVEVGRRHQLAIAIKAYTALSNVKLSFAPIAGSALYNTTHLSFSVSPATVDTMGAGKTTTFTVTFMGSANQDYMAHLMVRSNGAVVGHAPVWARAVLPRAEDVLIVDLDGSSCVIRTPFIKNVMSLLLSLRPASYTVTGSRSDNDNVLMINVKITDSKFAASEVMVIWGDSDDNITSYHRSSTARAIQDHFLASVKRSGLVLSESLLERGGRREARFTTVLNAVAVEVAEGSETEHVVERMRSLPGVVNAWPDAQHRQTLFASGPLVGLPAAWGELLPRRAGEGVKVAVVDGGTSKDVPMMSGAGFAWPHDIPAPGLGETDNCNGKIVVSRFYADPSTPPAEGSAHSWPGPRDEGTRNISGMAPHAWVMNYKFNNSYGCKRLEGKNYTAKVILIRDGYCDTQTKIDNVAASGASGILIINYLDMIFSSWFDDDRGIAVAGIGRTGGNLLLKMTESTPEFSLSFELFSGPNTGDLITDFSSRGPSTDMGIGIDVAAPGHTIVAQGYGTGSGMQKHFGFGAVSGTSMACPHVSGIAALIRQRHPEFTAAEVKSALMTTSTIDVALDASRTVMASPLDTGAGRVVASAALDPTVFMQPQALSFSVVDVGRRHQLALAIKAYTALPNVSLSFVPIAGSTLYNTTHLSFSVFPATVDAMAAGQTTTFNVTFMGSANRDYVAHLMVRSNGAVVGHAPVWARAVLPRAEDVLIVDLDGSNCYSDLPDVSHVYQKAFTDAGFTSSVYTIPNCTTGTLAFPEDMMYHSYKAISVVTGSSSYNMPWVFDSLLKMTAITNQGTVLVTMGAIAKALVKQEMPPYNSFHSACAVSTLGLEDMPAETRTPFIKNVMSLLLSSRPASYTVTSSGSDGVHTLDVKISDSKFAASEVMVIWGDSDDNITSYPTIAAVLALAAQASKRVIVQLEDPSSSLIRSDRTFVARAIQDRFLESTKRNGLVLSESLVERGGRREARFTAVLNAVAVEVAEGSETEHVVQRMRSLPGVVNAWPDAQHHQTLFASGPLVGLPAAWGELLPRRAGEGVKVAVVDGGTSKDVPMMSGAGFAWPHDIPAPGLGETDNCNGKIVVSRFYADPSTPPAEGSAHSWPGPRDGSHGVQQRHPEFTAAEVKSALMTTSITDVVLDAKRTVMASPLDTGAGRVVASAALDPTVFMQPQALSFSVVEVGRHHQLALAIKAYTALSNVELSFVPIAGSALYNTTHLSFSVSPATVDAMAAGQTTTLNVSFMGSANQDYVAHLMVRSNGAVVGHAPVWARAVLPRAEDVLIVDLDGSNSTAIAKALVKQEMPPYNSFHSACAVSTLGLEDMPAETRTPFIKNVMSLLLSSRPASYAVTGSSSDSDSVRMIDVKISDSKFAASEVMAIWGDSDDNITSYRGLIFI